MEGGKRVKALARKDTGRGVFAGNEAGLQSRNLFVCPLAHFLTKLISVTSG